MKIICNLCGNVNMSGSLFCIECGVAINNISEDKMIKQLDYQHQKMASKLEELQTKLQTMLDSPFVSSQDIKIVNHNGTMREYTSTFNANLNLKLPLNADILYLNINDYDIKEVTGISILSRCEGGSPEIEFSINTNPYYNIPETYFYHSLNTNHYIPLSIVGTEKCRIPDMGLKLKARSTEKWLDNLDIPVEASFAITLYLDKFKTQEASR